MTLWQLLRLPGLKWILGHLAEIRVGFKLFPEGLKGIELEEKLVLKFDINQAPGYPQILEVTSQEANARLVLVGWMLRGKACYHPVRGHYIEQVEAFHRRRDQSREAPAFLVTTASNLRVGSLEG